ESPGGQACRAGAARGGRRLAAAARAALRREAGLRHPAAGARRTGELRALRRASAAQRGARRGRAALLQRGARPARAGAALLLAPARYPELFLAPEERTPEALWISLRSLHLSRGVVEA